MMQIDVRLLQETDIPAALRLNEFARWNQTESDWRRLLRLEPRGCLCATIAGNVVATITTTTYGLELAWIGMVLVDPEFRRLGIATRLMRLALDRLIEMGVATVKLDATPDGRLVYENLGFKEDALIERWEGVAGRQAVDCSTLDISAHQEVLNLDLEAFGADRSKLIAMLIEDSYVSPVAAMTTTDRRLTGYALARRGSVAAYLGPVVATVANAATVLLDGLLSQMSGQRVYVDLNTNFGGGREVLETRGLVKQRDLIRMSYGQENGAASSPSIFAIAGPEVG